MEPISASAQYIFVVQMDKETLTLRDIRHGGTLVFNHDDDNSPQSTLDDLKTSFDTCELILRIKGQNEIRVREGFEFTGSVVLHNVSLTDPILENAGLLDVSLPNGTFLSARFVSLESVSPEVKSKKILLAYGLYTGADLTMSGDINLVNGRRWDLGKI